MKPQNNTTPAKMMYKISTNMADNDYFTDNEDDAKNKFQTYIADYGDGIRLYEAEVPKDDTDEFEWEIIDSYDEDDYEEAPTPEAKELPTKGEWEFEQCRGNNRYEHIIFSRNGGNNGSYVIAQLGFGKYRDEKEPEEIKANAELIVKAVNERQALLDSHSELLHALIHAQNVIDRLDDEYRDLSDRHSSYTRGDFNKIETAINNAKNIIRL